MLDGALFTPAQVDTDGDTVPDADDNCTRVPNALQRDSNGDGFGNLCDADITGDGLVTTSWGEAYPLDARGDVEWMAMAIESEYYDPDADLDGDGVVDEADLAIAQLFLFLAPGPSGVARP